MQRSKIEYLAAVKGYSCNPIRAVFDGKRGHACTKVSPGCERCYAEAWNRRFGTGLRFTADDTAKVTFVLDEKELAAIRRLRRPSTIFVQDMCDLFHRNISVSFVAEVFDAMRECKQHRFLVLTKRASLMTRTLGVLKPLPNILVGVTAEDQLHWDKRRWYLKGLADLGWRTWVSFEPLLGPIDTGDWLPDWVTVGGETGGRAARACSSDWILNIIAQCQQAETPCFVKAWGSYAVGSNDYPVRLKDKRGADLSEWPEVMQVQEPLP